MQGQALLGERGADRADAEIIAGPAPRSPGAGAN